MSAFYYVLEPGDLLRSSVPACICRDLDSAIESAASRKGYVVAVSDGVQTVEWVSPKFDVQLMQESLRSPMSPITASALLERRARIMQRVNANRIGEVA